MNAEQPSSPAQVQRLVGLRPYYEEAGITIYHADCAQVLPFLEPVDLLLTDPPYGIGESQGKNKSRSKLAKAKDYGNDDWDASTPPSWALEMAISKAGHAIVWGGNYFHIKPSSCWLVWDKDNGESDFADCELAWTNLPCAVRRIKWRWAGMLQENMGAAKEIREHPTQKPLAVMSWAINRVPDAATILDPFMGSGTTLVAAKNLGKRAIGIERELKYCEIAVRRLAQQTLFQVEQSNSVLSRAVRPNTETVCDRPQT